MKNLGLFILGFLVLKMPYGYSNAMIRVYILSLFILFFLTLKSVFFYFPKSSISTKVISSMMYIITFLPFVIRVLSGFGYDALTLRELFLQLTLINLFTFSMRNDFWGMLKIIDYIFCSYLIINFLSIIVFPDGMYVVNVQDTRKIGAWFLGIKNFMIRTIVPIIVVDILVSYHYKGHLEIKNFIVVIISIASVFLTGSSTGIIVVSLLSFSVLFLPIIKKIKYFIPSIVFFCYLAISIGIVVFGIQDRFSYYIENLFEKDVTFSGRTLIWEFALMRIFFSPIWGFGYHSGEEWHDVLGFMFANNIYASHPHNYMLYILLQGGFVLLVLFVLLFCYISHYSKPIRNTNEFIFLTLMLSAFLVGGISESLTDAPLMFPLLGLYTIFIDQAKNDAKFKKKKRHIVSRIFI